MRRLGIVLLLVGAILPASALAAVAQPDLTRLTQLFAEQRAHPSTSVDKRIADERDRIRQKIDDELNELVNQAIRNTATESAADLSGAVDRQRSLVNALEEQRNEAKVDLALVREEATQGTPEDGMQARPAERIDAETAGLEERVAALEFFIGQQRERLDKLVGRERIQQFATLFLLLKIVLAVALVVALEQAVRTHVLSMLRSPSQRFFARKAVTIGTYSLMTLWVMATLTAEFPGIVTSFAIIGAGLAVALQDIVKDIVGWLLIIQGRRFSVGQRITLGGNTGDVLDITPLRTTLLEVAVVETEGGKIDVGRTGKTLSIPNAALLTQPLINYNTISDYLRIEMGVMITYQSDWKNAEAILRDILEQRTSAYSAAARLQQSSRLQLFYASEEAPGPAVYVDIVSSGVQFALRFFVPVGERRRVLSEINREILERFAVQNPPIELAYNTVRSYSTTLTVDGKQAPIPGHPMPPMKS